MTTLTAFKRSEQLSFQEVLADHVDIEGLAIAGAADDPGRERKPKARRMTKADAVSPAIVTQWPGEHVEPRRW